MSGWTAKLYSCSTHSCGHPRTESRASAVNLYRSASTMNPAFSIGRMFRSYRSAKSVQWIREKVVGVSRFCFFPLRVALRTSSEEFHSVKKTLYPESSSHRLRRYTWVDFPDPSSPSTAISFPGVVFAGPCAGIRSLLPFDFERHVHAEVVPEHLRVGGHPERLQAARLPAHGPDPQRPVLEAAVDGPDGGGVLLVQRVGDPEDGGEGPHRRPVLLGERLELRVGRRVRGGLPVVPG